jgi:hypothetical protein
MESSYLLPPAIYKTLSSVACPQAVMPAFEAAGMGRGCTFAGRHVWTVVLGRLYLLANVMYANAWLISNHVKHLLLLLPSHT